VNGTLPWSGDGVHTTLGQRMRAGPLTDLRSIDQLSLRDTLAGLNRIAKITLSDETRRPHSEPKELRIRIGLAGRFVLLLIFGQDTWLLHVRVRCTNRPVCHPPRAGGARHNCVCLSIHPLGPRIHTRLRTR
jgi:hypothetical protein